MLWQALRRSQLEGFRFKRQVPINGYILDFVCFEARLIVEVDGAQHAESIGDLARDAHFSKQGFRTMRVWNHEVTTNLEGVCLTILAELKNSGVQVYLAPGGRESNFNGLGIANWELRRFPKRSAISKSLKLQERWSSSRSYNSKIGCIPTYPLSCKN